MSYSNIKTKKDKTRYALKRRNKSGRSRLSVFCSNQYIYAQLINDAEGITLASASSKEKNFTSTKSTSNIEAAKAVGMLIAKRINEKKLNTKIVFDRGDKKYHGKIKYLAEAMREGGIEF